MYVNKIKFTLDNLIYNCTINDDEEVQIILPRRTPNVVYNEKENLILSPASQVKITIYFDVKTAIAPKVTIESESASAVLNYSGDLILNPNSRAIMQLRTTDGGWHWYINKTNYGDSNTPVPIEAITSVNKKTGSAIILNASDIMLSEPIAEGQPIVSVQQQFVNVDNKINNMQQVIVNEVTGEITRILPDMIEYTLANGTKIVAPLI